MAGAEAWALRNMKIIENQLSSKDRHYTGKKRRKILHLLYYN